MKYTIAALASYALSISLQVTAQDTEVIEVLGQNTATLFSFQETDFGNGFNRNEIDIGRTIDVIGDDELNFFRIENIQDLTTQISGTHNTSSFGVPGSIDIRGSYAELFYQGFRRLSNPGNYPTQFQHYSSVEVIKGAPSSNWGLSRIGGAVNLNPLVNVNGTESTTQEVQFGSYDAYQLHSRFLNQYMLGDQALYTAFDLVVEDRDSFYRNHFTKNYSLAGSIYLPLESQESLEVSAQIQRFKTTQVTGWNRLTQDLIDNQNYITGSAQPLDTNNDGLISGQEIADAGGLGGFGTAQSGGCCGPQFVSEELIPSYFSLTNVGLATLSPQNVLVAPNDFLNTDVGLIHATYSGANWTHGLFAETVNMDIETAFGFSDRVSAQAFEYRYSVDLPTFSDVFDDFNHIFSLSSRYTEGAQSSDFFNQFFDRRDLTKAPSALDSILLATQQTNPIYAKDFKSSSWNTGVSWMFDAKLGETWLADGSIRLDYIDADVKGLATSILAANQTFSGSDTVTSYHLSLVKRWSDNVNLYTTFSRSHSLAESYASVLEPELFDDNFVGQARLFEVGLKAQWLDGAASLQIAGFRQHNIAINTQDLAINSTVQSEGFEIEAGYIVNDKHRLQANASYMDVVNLDREVQFSYFGATDLPQLSNPSVYFGGALAGDIPLQGDGEKGGIPDYKFNLHYLYQPSERWIYSLTYSHVASTFSGVSQTLKLPSYSVINSNIQLLGNNWQLRLHMDNLTDELWFTSNLPDIFGNITVLPSIGRTYNLSFTMNY